MRNRKSKAMARMGQELGMKWRRFERNRVRERGEREQNEGLRQVDRFERGKFNCSCEKGFLHERSLKRHRIDCVIITLEVESSDTYQLT